MNEQDVDTSRVLNALRRRRKALVALGLAGLVVGAALAFIVPALPSATAVVLLPDQVTEVPGTPTPDVKTQIVLAESTPVLTTAISRSGIATTPRTLRRHLDVVANSSDVLSITAAARTGPQAIELANAVARSYVSYVTTTDDTSAGSSIAGLQSEVQSLSGQLHSVQGQIAHLQGVLAGRSVAPSNRPKDVAALSSLQGEEASITLQINSLDNEITDARLGSVLAAGSVRVLQPATSANHSSLLRPLIFALAGAVAGFVLAFLLVVLGATRRRQLYRRSEIAATVGLPVVASVSAGRCKSTGEWNRAIEEEPLPRDEWNLARALAVIGIDGPGSTCSAAVLVLAGDRRALSVPVRLAAAAARRGVSSALVLVGADIPDELRAACTLSGRSERPALLATFDSEERYLNARDSSATIVATALGQEKPELRALPGLGVGVLAVTAGFASGDDLARLALAASGAGLEIRGVVVVNPDDRDVSIGAVTGSEVPTDSLVSRTPAPTLSAPTSRRLSADNADDARSRNYLSPKMIAERGAGSW